MALTDCQKRLIRAIANNDIKNIRKCAIACCAEDTSQKNANFVNEVKEILLKQEKGMTELPYDLKNIVCVEDVSEKFVPSRYYLSDREKAVANQIMRMAKTADILKGMKIPYCNSTMLWGESGTGKTTFARYIAYKMKLPFCYLKFSTLVDSLMGSTSKNISKAFSFASSVPCVLMLDEIDAISINRSSASGGSCEAEMARITITIMQELDNLPNDVIVLAATNRLDRIDNAVLRRFSVKHEVKPFKEDENRTMIKMFLDDVQVELSDDTIERILSNEVRQSGIINSTINAIAEKVLHKLETDEE